MPHGTFVAGTIDGGSIGGTPQDLNFAVGGVTKGKISGTTGELEMNGKKIINGLLAEYVVTGSAVTSIDFTGLDINTHKSYRIEMELINATASGADIYMFANGDTVNTNYYTQALNTSGTVVNVERVNFPRISSMAANQSGLGVVGTIFRHSNTSMTARFNGMYNVGASSDIYDTSWWKSSSTNITQLTFTASVASSIGVGSKIRIYRGDV